MSLAGFPEPGAELPRTTPTPMRSPNPPCQTVGAEHPKAKPETYAANKTEIMSGQIVNRFLLTMAGVVGR